MRKIILSAALVFTLGIPLAASSQQAGGGAGTGAAGTPVGGTVGAGTGNALGGTGSTVGGTQTPSTGSFTMPSTQPLTSSGLSTGTGSVNGLGQTGTGGAGQVGAGTTVTQPGTAPGMSTGIPPLGGTPAPNVTGTNTGVGAPGGASNQGTPGGSAALTPQQAQEEIARLQAEVRRLQAEAERNRDEGTGGSGSAGEDTGVASAVFEGRVKGVSQQAIEVIDFESGEPYVLRVNDGTRAARGAQRIPLARIQEGSRVRASFDLVSGETVATHIQVLKRR
jgi:hypothetical protein